VLETLPDDFTGRDKIVAGIEAAAPIKRAATLADVENVAAWAASDLARTITATDVNISCGSIMDQRGAPRRRSNGRSSAATVGRQAAKRRSCSGSGSTPNPGPWGTGR
jgi:hypothetical protein